MTHFILRSALSDVPAFEAAVKQHVIELQNYDKHMRMVAAGKADPYPGPTANPIVDLSVARIPAADGATLFKPDYQITDQILVPDGNAAMLAARKDELRAEVAAMERAALNDLLPMGKWRFAGLSANAASARLNKIQMADPAKADKAFGKLSPEDQKTLKDEAARSAARDAIHLHHAEMEAKIEDLDFATVNDWHPEPFKGNAK